MPQTQTPNSQTPGPKSPLIELKDVSKHYVLESGTEIKVLEGVNVNVYEDEFVALLGPSGSGTSTCLRILSGLTPATPGDVLPRGTPLAGTNLDVATVFQCFALF